jgi:hypothetical protein
LFSLQKHILDQRSEAVWLKAEGKTPEKPVQFGTGIFSGTPVQELASP